MGRNDKLENCIVKTMKGHWHLHNEAHILQKYQAHNPSIRPIIDEIVNPQDPPSTVLKYLATQLLDESGKKRLSRPEIKQVAKSVLQALCALHKDGKVHTGRLMAGNNINKHYDTVN